MAMMNGLASRARKRADALSRKLFSRLPHVKTALEKAYPEERPEDYVLRNLLLTAVFGSFFGLFMVYLLLAVRKFSAPRSLLGGMLIGVLVWLLMLLVFVLVLPSIRARKRAEILENHLLFALREMRLLAEAGYPLEDALVHISQAEYAELSIELERLVRDIEGNVPLSDSFSAARQRNPSESFGKVLALVESSLHSGSALRKGLDALISALDAEQKATIRSYAKDLNLWTLMYLLFAVAIPTIGAVLLLVLSAFVGGGMGPSSYFLLIALCFVVQAALIGFIRSRRPLGV